MRIAIVAVLIMIFDLPAWCQNTGKKQVVKKNNHTIVTTIVQAGNENADSLEIIELACDTLSSTVLKTKHIAANPRYPGVVTYNSDDGVYLSYYVSDKNQWLSILTPFTSETSDVQIINLDGKGKPEIIVMGEIASYGGHGGTTDFLMMVLNIDNAPKQIFKIIYGGSIEIFGDVKHKTILETYKRSVRISSQGIYISPLSKKSITGNETNIKSGKYIMQNGVIVKAA
jgi:hypothetical protein